VPPTFAAGLVVAPLRAAWHAAGTAGRAVARRLSAAGAADRAAALLRAAWRAAGVADALLCRCLLVARSAADAA
jgi:hypothetical protein